MVYALIWLGAAVLLAAWSMFVWLLHAVSAWSVANAAHLGDPAAWLGQLNLPGWLSVWLPADVVGALQASVAAVWPWFASVLDWLPNLGGALGVLAWAVWAAGLLLLLAGAGAGHLLAVWARRPKARLQTLASS